MAGIPWRYNSFCLISFKKGRGRFSIPIPLSLAQDFVEAICWILYWVIRLTSNTKIQAKINRKLPFELKSREILRILKMPHWFFTELRFCGSLVLVRIRDEDFFMEIRLI